MQASEQSERRYDELRHEMVERQLVARGLRDPRVVEAMRRVPRHRFVPAELAGAAYGDLPLPIGHGQTISQPLMVALLLEALELGPEDRVLDVGTGSGYQAALLAELVREVYSLEIVPELAAAAAARLGSLGYAGVRVRVGDGRQGWVEQAPFDAIAVAAAAEDVPRALTEQLALGGRLVIPVGAPLYQTLLRVRRGAHGMRRDELGGCVFVPLVGSD